MHIIILSRKSENAIQCVRSIFDKDPTFPRKNIVVVNDGAREKAEAELPGITWLEGEKPFIFSRNANIGMRYAQDDILLLNDDTTLETQDGFTSMDAVARKQQLGLVSCALIGDRIREDIHPKLGKVRGLRPTNTKIIAFVATYIPKNTQDIVGEFDERYVKYGWEDNDYCLRLLKHTLGCNCFVFDGCVVRHHEAFMTFHGTEETNGITHWYEGDNAEVFHQKWK